MDSIRTALEAALRHLPASATQEPAVVAWQVIAGPTLSARTRAERVEAGVLYVTACDLIWKKQLDTVHGELLRRLQAVVGAERVRDIRFAVANADPALAGGAPGNATWGERS